MGESWKHYTELNKPVTKSTRYDSIYIWNVQNGQFHKDRKQKSGCQRLGEGKMGSDY